MYRLPGVATVTRPLTTESRVPLVDPQESVRFWPLPTMTGCWKYM